MHSLRCFSGRNLFSLSRTPPLNNIIRQIYPVQEYIQQTRYKRSFCVDTTEMTKVDADEITKVNAAEMTKVDTISENQLDPTLLYNDNIEELRDILQLLQHRKLSPESVLEKLEQLQNTMEPN